MEPNLGWLTDITRKLLTGDRSLAWQGGIRSWIASDQRQEIAERGEAMLARSAYHIVSGPATASDLEHIGCARMHHTAYLENGAHPRSYGNLQAPFEQRPSGRLLAQDVEP